MLKIWCENCKGQGTGKITMTFSNGQTVVNDLHCELCQGIGWVALEPEIKVDWDDTIHFTNDRENTVEVYIKESK